MTDKPNSLDVTITMLRERAPTIDWDLFLKVMTEANNRGDEERGPGRSPSGQKAA
jgi:hypothetical protein